MSHVDNEDKRIEMLPNSQNGNTVGKVTLINESGLYSLILRSKLEKAKRFKRWVTSEVLPTLRKHGMYVTDDLLNNPDLAIKAFTTLKEEREKNKALEAELEKKEEKVNTLLEDNNMLLESNNTLLESNEELTTSNKVFVTNVNTWDYKSILNSLVRVYAMTCFSGRFGQAWNDYFKQLKYKYHIDLKKRKASGEAKGNEAIIDLLREDEISDAVRMIVAICEENGINTGKIIKKVNSEKYA